jgi:ubiquinone/menaquinone biosynthesis C-methylase UbiE
MDSSEHASATTAATPVDTTKSRSTLRRSGDVTRFTDLDLTPDVRFFVDFMDVANAQPDRQRFKAIIAERLSLSAGDRVLDVGCGTGDDVRALAMLVAPAGEVIGIDASETMISVAQERSRAGSLPVEFAVGDAAKLDFSDNTFDACRCETVLMHLEGDPARAIAEMARVTRAGGHVVVSDFHWDALVIDHPDRKLTRTIVHTACDMIRHGWIGSQLPRLMADAGLIDVQLEGHALRVTHQIMRHVLKGPLTQAQQQDHLDQVEIAEWWRPLEEAEARGQFLATMLTFIVTGTVAA